MIQNIPKEKVLEIVKEGPTIPSKIVKRLGGDTMLMGAILSTLVSTGDISVSSLKIGGSPLYYIKDQESKLEEFLNYINEKDRRTFALIKEKQILKDIDQDPLIRVSLRTIKDFAKQFEIETAGVKTLYWRYYLLDKESALKKIIDQKEQAEKEADEALEVERINAIKSAEEIRIKEYDMERKAKELARDQKENEEKEKREEKENKEEKTHTDISESILEDITAVKKETKKVHTLKHPIVHPTSKLQEDKQNKQTPLNENTHEDKHQKKDDSSKYDFFEMIRTFIHAKNLDIISKEKIKKTEYILILKNHETNDYIYCSAKDKKSINEGDLASAFVFAHTKKMPCMFLMSGNMTKKAESMLQKEFKDMTIEKM